MNITEQYKIKKHNRKRTNQDKKRVIEKGNGIRKSVLHVVLKGCSRMFECESVLGRHLSTDSGRWSIEVFFKFAKQNLGLGKWHFPL